jgi:opacity protein-like surface antigen
MNKTAFVFIGVALAVSTPALARDGDWYVGVDAGVALVNRASVTPVGGLGYEAGPQLPTSIKTSAGYDIDGVVGRDLGLFRLEAEIANKSAANKSYTSAGYTAFPTPDGGIAVAGPGTYSDLSGRQSVFSMMANGLVDVGHDKGLQASFGGGIGWARSHYRLGINSYGDVLNDHQSGFAWQLLAGLRMPVSQSVDLGVKYRYFQAPTAHLSTLGGTDITSSFHSHSVMASVSYNFGKHN